MIIFLHMSTACCSIPMHSASSRPDFKALSSDITPCLARNAVGFWCQRQYYVRANSPFKPYIYPTLRSVEPSEEQTQTLDKGSILVTNQCHFVNWTTFTLWTSQSTHSTGVSWWINIFDMFTRFLLYLKECCEHEARPCCVLLWTPHQNAWQHGSSVWRSLTTFTPTHQATSSRLSTLQIRKALLDEIQSMASQHGYDCQLRQYVSNPPCCPVGTLLCCFLLFTPWRTGSWRGLFTCHGAGPLMAAAGRSAAMRSAAMACVCAAAPGAWPVLQILALLPVLPAGAQRRVSTFHACHLNSNCAQLQLPERNAKLAAYTSWMPKWPLQLNFQHKCPAAACSWP